MSHDQQYQSYLRYYENQQRGGQYVAFRGARRWQKGDGFGDVLRGIFRWFLPVISSGASTFIRETAAGQARGENLGDAAKGALRPTLGSVIGAVGKRMQGGSGRRKRVTKKSRKRVYKGRQKGGKRKAGKKTFPARKRKVTRKTKKVKKATRRRTKNRKQSVDEQSYNF